MGFACPKGWLNISRKTYSSSACFFFLFFFYVNYILVAGGWPGTRWVYHIFQWSGFQLFWWVNISPLVDCWSAQCLELIMYLCTCHIYVYIYIYIYTVCTCPEACPLFGWRSFQFFLVRCISSSWVKDEDGWTLIASSLIQALVWSVHPSEGTTHMAIKLSFIKSFP